MENLVQLLANEPDQSGFYASLTPSNQARYQQWFDRAKNSEDRQVRLRHIQHELINGHRRLTIGSYMGNVRAPNPKMDDVTLRAKLIETSEQLSHRQMAVYVIALCQHVATKLNLLDDPLLHETITINKRWLAGEITFKEARAYAGVPMQHSRDALNETHRLFYRMLHQAAVTPHVKRHALIASDFALETLLTKSSQSQVATKERTWQCAQLLKYPLARLKNS